MVNKTMILGIIILIIILIGGSYAYTVSKIEIKSLSFSNIDDISLSGFTLSGYVEIYNGGFVPVEIDHVQYDVILEKTGIRLADGYIQGSTIYPRSTIKLFIKNRLNWRPTADIAAELLRAEQAYIIVSGNVYITGLRIIELKIPFQQRIDIKPYIEQFVVNSIQKVVDTGKKIINKIGEVISNIVSSNNKYTTPTPTTNYYKVNMDKIANNQINHLTNPPLGDVTLGNIPFFLDRSFVTEGTYSPDHPNEGILNINVGSPLKVYILINGDNWQWFYDKYIGKIILRFDDGEFEKSIIAGKNLRGTWSYNYENFQFAPDPDWQNVLTEDQQRGDKSAKAFIDMLTISIPYEFQSKTLTEISIIDDSENSVASIDPNIIISGITIEHL